MELNFEKGALLLLISAVVAMLTRRLRLPYSVGLVVAGIVLALLPFSPDISLTKELLFTVLLPPLIFREAKAHGRLLLLIESESLFNDGTAAVLYAICVALALGHTLTPLEITTRLAVSVGGSLICGAIVAGVVLFWRATPMITL